jgi:hypothetical protein
LPPALPLLIFLIFRFSLVRRKRLILLGSPGRIRTSDQPVNSRLLYH